MSYKDFERVPCPSCNEPAFVCYEHELQMTTERNRLLDQAVLGFGLSEGEMRRLDYIEKVLRIQKKKP